MKSGPPSSVARRVERVSAELLHAERNALLLLIDIEHFGANDIALLVVVDHLLAGLVPVEIGEMNHTVHIAFEADEQTELGLVLDLSLDNAANRMLLSKIFPRIGESLLEAERNTPLDRIDFENLHIDFLARRDDLARVDVFLGPGHFGDVNQAFDARLQFDERAVVGDVGHAAMDTGIDRIFGVDALPRIVEQLLHAERDAVRLVIDLDDLHLDRLADGQNLARMIDAAPGNVGDVQQAVDAAEVHERTIIGDVLDHAVDDLTLFEVGDDLVALLGAALFKHGAAETTILPRRRSILRIWNGCVTCIKGVTSRIGRISTWLRGRKATAPSRSTVKPPLT